MEDIPVVGVIVPSPAVDVTTFCLRPLVVTVAPI
jgi:hypothetical protein